MTGRKLRSDAKLAQLSMEQRDALAALMLNGMTPPQARAYVAKEFKVLAGDTAFYNFWQSECVPVLLARRQQIAQTAKAFGAQAERDNAAMDKAFVTQLKQMGYELALRPNAKPEEVFFVLGQVLKLRDQELKERGQAQDEKKIEQTERLKGEELKVKQRLAAVAEMKIGELLLKAAQDARAKEIAGLDCPNAEKIELLRKHYLADVDALEKSGAVKLPPLP